MRALKRPSRSVRTRPAPDIEFGADAQDQADGDEAYAESTAATDVEDVYDIFRVHCPDCARPIALLEGEERLPEHAQCSSPWNPFGLTVCAGSGRTVTDARPLDEEGAEAQDAAVLLTLPAGLDWRTQPFSHAGGPGSRPLRAAQRIVSRH
ncbi:hypothetical protein POF50_021750 [Streptomyces sp. SL13]|uniref:Uncharacterized protein n=1 Tax=Streptantibioticus silvisoli TaxID=2705255 RepID=A0AA90H666_9ACTN|nr:hypothetical protein [Streptantibioticus silvisoli]MDI5966110.1 hypothetical protein [Streptantibioticus silvisoli]MDI5971926.1 hypothetical protein [Streptantibioticus silvisoli]